MTNPGYQFSNWDAVLVYIKLIQPLRSNHLGELRDFFNPLTDAQLAQAVNSEDNSRYA